MDELDLEHEGAQARTIGRALRRVDGVVVPGVHSDLCGDEVLVTDFLDGPTLLEIAVADRVGAHYAAADLDPALTARTLLAAYLRTVASTGLVATDPRPGHVVLYTDGSVGVLGMGAARPWPAERLEAILDALLALRDPSGADPFAAVASGRLRVLDDAEARAAHSLLRDILGDLITGAARLDTDAIDAVVDRALARLPEAFALAARATPEPADISALRGAGQLVATLAGLGATEDWVPLAAALLRGQTLQ
jgi:predicted unusual protein kinase regulating ubiquinone biosynthesis (AarF/ABC1/UbiB family)